MFDRPVDPQFVGICVRPIAAPHLPDGEVRPRLRSAPGRRSLVHTFVVGEGGWVVHNKCPWGSTPGGRPFTKHYGTEQGPVRNLPGSVLDNTIDNYPGVPVPGGKTVHYDPINNVTVVTGDGGAIVSAHKGPPPSGSAALGIHMTFVCLSAGLFEQDRIVTLDCVLDVDDYGEIIGIEIVSPRLADAGIDWTRTTSLASIHVAYDEVADAVYLRLAEERVARDQVLRSASLHVDAGNVVRMISISATSA